MTAIGNHAFYGCTSLESVEIPSTIADDGNAMTNNPKWGAYSFAQCSNLKYVTLPEGLTVIGLCVFENIAVESIVIPSTIKTWIKSHNFITEEPIAFERRNNSNCAFLNCKKLSSVTFTDGIETIVNSPFFGCSALRRVTIPSSVTEFLGGFAYSGLQEVYRRWCNT